MSNYKIHVKNKYESHKAQEYLFALGCLWSGNSAEFQNTHMPYLYAYMDDKVIMHGDNESKFHTKENQEVTLDQLHDLYILHRNDVNDANYEDGPNKFYKTSSDSIYHFFDGVWIQANPNVVHSLTFQIIQKPQEYLEPQDDDTYKLINWTCTTFPPESFIKVPDGADFLLKMCTGLRVGDEFFFKYDEGDLRLYRDSEWISASHYCVQDYIDEGDELLWSRKPIQQSQFDTAFISCADAKKAWANGENVQIKCHDGTFCTITHNLKLSIFDNEKNKFRLKPKTIFINGIEVPAPNFHHPDVGQIIIYLDDSEPQGFTSERFSGHYDPSYNYGWWDSEEKIKLVVDALQDVFKGAI